jgi:outer membrane protein assembly factor BamB
VPITQHTSQIREHAAAQQPEHRAAIRGRNVGHQSVGRSVEQAAAKAKGQHGRPQPDGGRRQGEGAQSEADTQRSSQQDRKPAVSETWKNKQLTSYFSTPVAIGTEHIYMVTGTASPLTKPSANLHCIEAKTGKELWKKEKIGTYHASLMRTGEDKLLMLTDGGELVLVEPNSKEYRPLARAKVSGPETWAHPALANGRLYIRDKTGLICLQLVP